MEDLDNTYQQKEQQISDAVNALRNKTPNHILKMTLKELRQLEASRINQIGTPETSTSGISKIHGSGSVDDGYNTEATRSSSKDKEVPRGPLQSAIRNRRRSRSVEPANRSSSQSSSGLLPRPGLKKMTPMSMHCPRYIF